MLTGPLKPKLHTRLAAVKPASKPGEVSQTLGFRGLGFRVAQTCSNVLSGPRLDFFYSIPHTLFYLLRGPHITQPLQQPLHPERNPIPTISPSSIRRVPCIAEGLSPGSGRF